MKHRYIEPRRPRQTDKVERSHRVDSEEFWGRHAFAEFDAAATALRGPSMTAIRSTCRGTRPSES